MIKINGAMGEGGGQILRTSLALSMVTGKPFTIENIRAGRGKPGLMRQHLTCVEAAARVCSAYVTGGSLGSGRVEFSPGPVNSGVYEFSIGSAGSASLVLQTILPPLMTADGESRITLEGGTHNPFAPPFEFLQKSFLPLLARMGPKVEAVLKRPGFYPAGGGRIEAAITPSGLAPLNLATRGKIKKVYAEAVVSNLPLRIAQSETAAMGSALGLKGRFLKASEAEGARGPGNYAMVTVESEEVTEVFTVCGKRGLPARKVGLTVADEAGEYMESEAAAGRHLADQLLIPLALCGQGCFSTLAPTDHTITNLEVISIFLETRLNIEEAGKGIFMISA